MIASGTSKVETMQINFGSNSYSGSFYPGRTVGPNTFVTFLMVMSCDFPFACISITWLVKRIDWFSRFTAQTTCICARSCLSWV